MIDTLEVIDRITADCIEVGDIIKFYDANPESGLFNLSEQIVNVDSVIDNGDSITVHGYSEIEGDHIEVFFDPDTRIALLAEPLVDID